MKSFVIIISILVLGCNRTNTVNWDPYLPNVDVTPDDLLSNGFNLTTIDDGLCVYSNAKEYKNLNFYAELTTDCSTLKSQELYIKLKNSTNQDYNNFKLTEQIKNQIDSTLTTYNSRRTSDFNKVAACRINFKATNNDNITIEWDLQICEEDLFLTTYSDI